MTCKNYVFDACNNQFLVYYGRIWRGVELISIPQGTIELILRDDFERVWYSHYACMYCMQYAFCIAPGG